MSTNAKTAIVTGAAQGIGEAVALRLSREGFTHFLLIDCQADKLAGVAEALTVAGADDETLVLDLTDVAALTRDVDAAVAELGHVDALVNAAGTTARGGLSDTAPNTLKRDGLRAFGINLGWTWTPAEQDVQTKVHGLAEDWSETLGAKQPFGRLLMPEDPAGLIAFLTSKDAAMMTGAIIDLDQYVAGTVDDNPGV